MKNQLKIFIVVVILIFSIKPFSVSASTESASFPTGITDYSATFIGGYDVDGSKEHDTWFEYNTHNFGNGDMRIAEDDSHHSVKKGNPAVTWTVTDLHSNSDYWYRFCIHRDATNHCSSTVEFQTLPAPTAPTVTASVDDIQAKNAVLKGTYSSNRRSSQIWFQYGESSDQANVNSTNCSENDLNIETIQKTKSAFGLDSTGSMNETINNLLPGTWYCFRSAGENEVDISYSPIYSFRTNSTEFLPATADVPEDGSDDALSISTKGISGLESDSVTLMGSATPSAVNNTTVYFRYSSMTVPPVFCNEIYGSQMTSTADIPLTTGSGEQSFTTTIRDLQPDTTYYYCAIASTKKNIVYGNNQTAFSFTTLPSPDSPATVKTEKATEIDSNSATLNAFYNSTEPAKIWFQYMIKPSGISVITPMIISSQRSTTISAEESTAIKTDIQSLQVGSGPISATISGLQTGQTYEFWATIQRGNGQTIKGNMLSFKATPMGNSTLCGTNTTPNIYVTPSAVIANNYQTYSSKVSTSGQGTSTSAWQQGLNPSDIPYVGSSSAIENKNFSLPDGCTSATGFSTTTGLSCSTNLPKGCTSFTGFSIKTGMLCSKVSSPLIDKAASQQDYINQLFDGTPTINSPIINPIPINPTSNKPIPIPKPLIGFINTINLPINPCDPIVINPPVTPTNGGGTVISNGGSSTTVVPYTIGQIVTPPVDATVHAGEGIETVFARQIVGNTDLATRYGYDSGTDLQSFAWNLADILARNFGYVNSQGKEIRVAKADIAAYQLQLEGSVLTVYEYYNSKIVNIQKMSSVVRNNYGYEYYFNKK